MENIAHETEKAISGAIKIDEKEILDHIDGLVRPSVEDTLNALLNSACTKSSGTSSRRQNGSAAWSIGIATFSICARGNMSVKLPPC